MPKPWWRQPRAWLPKFLRLALRRKSFGRQGEEAAARYLRRQGYKIVAREHQEGKEEIDIIAVDGRTVVFVEVKARRSLRHGQPEEAVNLVKQQHICQAALKYLKRHDLLECKSRFDIVAIHWPKGERKPSIKHYQRAFDPPDSGNVFM